MNKWRFRSRIAMLGFLAIIMVRGYCTLPTADADPPDRPTGGQVLKY